MSNDYQTGLIGRKNYERLLLLIQSLVLVWLKPVSNSCSVISAATPGPMTKKTTLFIGLWGHCYAYRQVEIAPDRRRTVDFQMGHCAILEKVEAYPVGKSRVGWLFSGSNDVSTIEKTEEFVSKYLVSMVVRCRLCSLLICNIFIEVSYLLSFTDRLRSLYSPLAWNSYHIRLGQTPGFGLTTTTTHQNLLLT